MLQLIQNEFWRDFAVDMGTANTLVHVKGRGIVANEPSCVALRKYGSLAGEVLAFGQKAVELGRNGQDIESVCPLRCGTIYDFELAQALLSGILGDLHCNKPIIKPRAVLSLPMGATPLERHALLNVAQLAGAGEVRLIPGAVAAAMGAGLPVEDACGFLIIDIGGGSTDVSIVSMGGVVCSESIHIGGNRMNERIIEHTRKTHHVSISEQSAEEIKIGIGSAASRERRLKHKVQGRDLRRGMPVDVRVSQAEVFTAIKDCLIEVVRLTYRVLHKVLPEIAADIDNHGILLVGGGAQLRDLDIYLSQQLEIAVTQVESPSTVGVKGCAKLLESRTLSHLSSIIF